MVPRKRVSALAGADGGCAASECVPRAVRDAAGACCNFLYARSGSSADYLQKGHPLHDHHILIMSAKCKEADMKKEAANPLCDIRDSNTM